MSALRPEILSSKRKHAIFTTLVATEDRLIGKPGWHGAARASVCGQYNVSRPTLQLIEDEGIREGWLDGEGGA